MSKFAVYDATGEILHTIACPDDADEHQEPGPGLFLFKGETGPRDRIDPATGALIVDAKPPLPSMSTSPPEPAYVRARRLAYPSMQQQLEWLWQAMDRGEMQKVEPFYGQIQAVKSQFPKAVDMTDHGESIEL